MAGKLKWETPPPSRGGRPGGRSHAPLAKDLKKKPGEWALILTYPNAHTARTIAGGIRTGRVKAWQPAGTFEAKSRTVGQEHRVYARYLGENGEHAGEGNE